MDHVYNWLIVLAFVLGLLLTFALMIRRVKREVPVGSSAGAAGLASTKGKSASESGTTKAGAVKDAPYGAGSARAGADGSGPKGWTIKGNEDSMLYHTPDSPAYEQTIAEIWFREEQAAERAGFTRWDKGKASGGAAKAADVPAGPFGAGSARAEADGSGPKGWLVKGNEDSMLYHTPDSPAYEQTIAEVWFKDEESAKQGGFSSWHKGEAKK